MSQRTILHLSAHGIVQLYELNKGLSDLTARLSYLGVGHYGVKLRACHCTMHGLSNILEDVTDEHQDS
jgi:hypothetical protein